MSQPYVGQIMIFGGNFAPAGWMLCAGQLLPISEFDTLFNLIGTTYGGDGEQTFGLPNLQGRVPVHMGQGAGLSSYIIGEAAGTESVTLTTQQIPVHNHLAVAANAAGNSKTSARHDPVQRGRRRREQGFDLCAVGQQCGEHDDAAAGQRTTDWREPAA